MLMSISLCEGLFKAQKYPRAGQSCLIERQYLFVIWSVFDPIRYMICFSFIGDMHKPNPWKFQSNQKLSSKVTPTSTLLVPSPQLKRTDSFSGTFEELDNFSLTPPRSSQMKDESSSFISGEKQVRTGQRLQQMQKRSKQREQAKRNKGLAGKMKVKLQEQIRAARKQWQQKQKQLQYFTGEIASLKEIQQQYKNQSEDIVNKEQMLAFKESQLNNLITIHSEILEGAKKEVANEKQLKLINEEKISNLCRQIGEIKTKWREKQDQLLVNAKIQAEKRKMEEFIVSQRQIDAKKTEIRSEAIRDIVHQLLRKNKREVEEECEYKVRIIRQTSNALTDSQALRSQLTKKGLLPSMYYTFTQLKFVPQLNFRVNRQAEKIMQLFHREINPKIPEIIEHFEEPIELIRLKEELRTIQKKKIDLQLLLREREIEIENCEDSKKKLADSLAEIKKKLEAK